MAERPEGGFRRPDPQADPQAGRGQGPDEAWPAPGDTQRLGPPPDEAGPAAARPASPPLPALPALPALPPMTPLPGPTEFGFRPQTEPSAVLALVLAITAWVACPILAAIAALMIAGGAKAKIEVSGGAFTGLGLVTAARWIAWIHIFLVSLGTIALIVGVNVFGTVLS
jgi:hypothetical protein